MAEDVYLSEGQLSTDDGIVSPTVGGLTVRGDLDVSGDILTVGGDRLATLESIGAQVPQTNARTEVDRWLAGIRNAGAATPPTPPGATFHYVGGDVTDGLLLSNNTVLWVLADYYANSAGQDPLNADDTYSTTPLSLLQRNGAISEATPGTFSAQLHASGNGPGIWLSAETHGGFGSDRIWWPLSIIENTASNFVVAMWFCDTDTPTPHGTITDSHLVTLNGFLGYSSTTQTGLDPAKFAIQCMRKDATYVYILGGEFVPSYTTSWAIGTLDELRDQHMLSRLARVPLASLTTMASWQFWNGSTWVAGQTSATPLVDTAGNLIKGAAGISRTSSGRWLLVAAKTADTHLQVFGAAEPQGPYEPVARVPIPTAGRTIGTDGVSTAWHCKVIEHRTATRAEHSVAMMTMTVLGLDIGESTGQNIRRWAPQFVEVPWY